MAKKTISDKPVVHFTEQGDRYVRIDDLFKSKAAREALDGMVQISNKQQNPANMPEKTNQSDP